MRVSVLRRSRGIVVGAAVALATASLGCASYFTARDARQAYYECLEEPERSVDDCEAERVRADAEFDRYEEEAERSWGCENTTDGCVP